MSRIASLVVSGWSTRTPTSSWAMRAAQLRLTGVCGDIITRVNATFFIVMASLRVEWRCAGVIVQKLAVRVCRRLSSRNADGARDGSRRYV